MQQLRQHQRLQLKSSRRGGRLGPLQVFKSSSERDKRESRDLIL
jgi:hypothetical protein